MQIETLKVYCDLVETASFSAAAERNSLTQSAVSQKIRALEGHFGVTLIERGAGKPFRLTAEGRIFLDGCREVLAAYDTIPRRLLESQGELNGEIRLLTLPSLGLYELAEPRRKFRRRYPAVRLEVAYAPRKEAYEKLASGEADAVLLAHPGERDGFNIEICWRERLVLVCPLKHRLARYGTIGLRDLRGELLVHCAPDEVSQQALADVFARANVEITTLFEVRNAESALRSVEIEGALTILPEKHAKGDPGVMRTIEINSSEMWRPVGLVRRSGEEAHPALSELLRTLRES